MDKDDNIIDLFTYKNRQPGNATEDHDRLMAMYDIICELENAHFRRTFLACLREALLKDLLSPPH